MSEPWVNIVATFHQKQGIGDDAFRAAVAGVEQVAILIAEGPLKPALFGWTSMHDLCVQQTDVSPYSGPYLRISPLLSGLVEFRYIDTAVAHRQWNRLVPADAAPNQFTAFLHQLRWAAFQTPAVNEFTA
jgi:hypothetical protein